MGLSKRTSSSGSEMHQTMVEAVVPPQRSGGKADVEISRSCSSVVMAEEVYRYLKLLLLDVNNWHRYVAGVSARFHLTDKTGHLTQHQATLGDHFKIRIPGPALQLGGGFDWTIVEAKEEVREGTTELFYLTAVPSRNPRGDTDDIAHFLKNTASTTFIAVKEARMVKIMIISRNEIPNNSVPGWKDKMRNRTVGFFAGIYFSRFQWAKLARSLMKAGMRSARMSDKTFAGF